MGVATLAVALSAAIAGVPSVAEAAPVEGFQPGNIISDANFYDAGAMSVSEIQSFLNDKVGRCTIGDPGRAPGTPIYGSVVAQKCLSNSTHASVGKAANAYCKAFAGRDNESAASIIARVANACNISPRVLLIMLEKEQSLVTDTWPTARQFSVAMGYACPDSGPNNSANCNSNYFGFANQVYYGAWQLQVYKGNPGSFNYRPYQTNTIQWHPNTGCGTSQVYIENWATASLYIYTPYRPNQAALNAGWGTGDGCSSYGNRNFYNFYKTWFGSPTSTPLLAKASGQSAVYLIVDGKKHHVQAQAYAQYVAAFGQRGTVSASYLAGLPNGPQASLYVKNRSNGQVAFLDGNKTHRFSTCALVADWGGLCGERLLSLPGNLFTRFGAGPEMTRFAKVAGSTQTYGINRTQYWPYYSAAVAKKDNGGVTPYAATLPAAAKAAKKQSYTRFDTASFIKVTGTSAVLLPQRDGRMLHLTSWAAAADLGLPSSVSNVVSASSISGYQAATKLGAWVTCGGKYYLGASGTLTQVPAGVAKTFAPATLDAPACAGLKKSSVGITGHVFVKAVGRPEVYLLENGKRMHVTTGALLNELAGGASPKVLTMQAASLDLIPEGTPLLQEGTFVRATGASEVYLHSGGTLIHLPSWELARAYGFNTQVSVLPQATIAAFPVASEPLGVFGQCGTSIGIAAKGTLVPLAQESYAAGNTVTALSSQACARLQISKTVRSAPVFVTDGTSTAAPVLGGFLRYASAEEVANASAGANADPILLTPELFASLPYPEREPAAGTLARSSSSTSVFLIDRGTRVALPNWGIAADLGISTPYEVFSPAALGKIPVDSGRVLSPIVTCGGNYAIAGSGRLRPISATAAGNLRATELSDASCSRFNVLLEAAVPRVILKSTDGESFYRLENGVLTAISATDAGAVNAPPAVTMDSRSIASLLTGSG